MDDVRLFRPRATPPLAPSARRSGPSLRRRESRSSIARASSPPLTHHRSSRPPPPVPRAGFLREPRALGDDRGRPRAAEPGAPLSAPGTENPRSPRRTHARVPAEKRSFGVVVRFLPSSARAPRPSPPGTTRPLTTPTPPPPPDPHASPLTRTARPREQRRRGGRVGEVGAREPRAPRGESPREEGPPRILVGDPPRAFPFRVAFPFPGPPSRRSRVSRPDVREAPRPPRRERGEAPRGEGARALPRRGRVPRTSPGSHRSRRSRWSRRSRLRLQVVRLQEARARSLGPLGRLFLIRRGGFDPRVRREREKRRRRERSRGARGAARGDARVPREGADPTRTGSRESPRQERLPRVEAAPPPVLGLGRRESTQAPGVGGGVPVCSGFGSGSLASGGLPPSVGRGGVRRALHARGGDGADPPRPAP